MQERKLTRGEVVVPHHVVPDLQQSVCQVAANEASTACYKTLQVELRRISYAESTMLELFGSQPRNIAAPWIRAALVLGATLSGANRYRHKRMWRKRPFSGRKA